MIEERTELLTWKLLYSILVILVRIQKDGGEECREGTAWRTVVTSCILRGLSVLYWCNYGN